MAHDVSQMEDSGYLVLSSGRGRKTAAFKSIAESLSVPISTVRDDYKRSRNYMLLLQEGGPGSLLNVGKDVSHL